MNLTLGGSNWSITRPGQPWVELPADRMDRNGTVLSLAADESAVMPLTPPGHHPEGVWIKCTYEGTGEIWVGNVPGETRTGDHFYELKWSSDLRNPSYALLAIRKTDPADPVRNIDCRESDAPKTQLFAQEFLDSLQPFGVIRFLDWQKTNLNVGGNWNERTLPTAMLHTKKEGVAIEHMVALANQLNADPWFQIPYNADAEYITKFAQLVHDNLPANRKVYVEFSNEVWNYAFPQGQQASQEGIAANLSDNQFQALLYRYTIKARTAMDIWKTVFADRPNQLVRVLGVQNANPWTSQTQLEYQDVPSHFDAVAVAPYFDLPYPRPDPGPVTVDDYITQLGAGIDQVLGWASQHKEIADRYHLRTIAYEGGQGLLVPGNLALQQQVQRDQRMYDLYKKYTKSWYERMGDLMNQFNATGPISQFGAWGMREYSGQPISETPKRRAMLEAAAQYKTRPAS